MGYIKLQVKLVPKTQEEKDKVCIVRISDLCLSFGAKDLRLIMITAKTLIRLHRCAG